MFSLKNVSSVLNQVKRFFSIQDRKIIIPPIITKYLVVYVSEIKDVEKLIYI